MWTSETKDGTLVYIPNLFWDRPPPSPTLSCPYGYMDWTYPEEHQVCELGPGNSPAAVEKEQVGQTGEFVRTRYPKAKKRVDLRRRVLRKNAMKWFKQIRPERG